MSTLRAHLQDRARRRFNRAYGACLCASQPNPLAGHDKTIVTTFHDFEGDYGLPGATARCLAATPRILDIERRHGIRSTYNVVASHARDVPGTMQQLLAGGHEIASHSYDHTVLTNLTSAAQLDDIRAAGAVFAGLGIAVSGHRSPLSRWNRSLMRHLCDAGHVWSAENGREPHPYVVHRSAGGTLWRFPVAADDWDYEASNLPPDHMLAHWQAHVNAARRTRRYTAIGFHPWIECDDRRLEALDRFMGWLRSLPDVQVLPFGEVHALLRRAHRA